MFLISIHQLLLSLSTCSPPFSHPLSLVPLISLKPCLQLPPTRLTPSLSIILFLLLNHNSDSKFSNTSSYFLCIAKNLSTVKPVNSSTIPSYINMYSDSKTPRRAKSSNSKHANKYDPTVHFDHPPVVSSSQGSSSTMSSFEPTANKKGFHYLRIDRPITKWLNSLPMSEKPLVDIGCATGFHTAHAISEGRDVIAVDCDSSHISNLRRRVDQQYNNASRSRQQKMGELIRAVVADLPGIEVCRANGASGVLCSEVLQFLKPGEPMRLFQDAYRWLQPGGYLVVITMSYFCMQHFVSQLGYNLNKGRSVDQARALMEQSSGAQLANEGVAYMELDRRNPLRNQMSSHYHMFSTKELRALAEMTGFEVKDLQYYSPNKYPGLSRGTRHECVLLVAKKPRK